MKLLERKFVKRIGKMNRKMGKKGQVTAFIIAGIVIVLIAVVIVMVTRTDVGVGERVSASQIEPIKEYIEACMGEELERNLELLRVHSGFFEQSNLQRLLGRIGNPVNLNFVLFGRSRKLPTMGSIEFEIERRIKEKLLGNECGLESFKENFIINEDKSKLNVDVSIGDRVTIVDVVYPILIEKGDFTGRLNEFAVQGREDFGLIFKFVNFIINEEMGGRFSMDQITEERFLNQVGDPNLFAIPDYYCEDENFCVGAIGTLNEDKPRFVFATCVGIECEGFL